jgi:spoIIIJ-associated protein
VSQKENVIAVTNDDGSGELPVAGGPDTDASPSSVSAATDQADAWEQGDPEDGESLVAGSLDAQGSAGGEGRASGDTGADAGDGDDVGDGETDGETADGRKRDVIDLEQESEIAADYVEGLLDVADLDGDIDMDVEGDRAVVSVVGATLQELVGPRGEVLEALQELTRLAVHRQTGVRTRIMLDVGGYRARRRTELTALGREAAEDVSRTGVARRLDPMTPFERKIVHDAVAAAGLRSESEGEEPNRRVVVLPVG